jgi:hypothetical protein
MVCESMSKGLVMQGEDASPPMHPTSGKLHCLFDCFFSKLGFYSLVFSKAQGRSLFMREFLPYRVKF